MIDLWPENLDGAGEVPPAAILRQQAARLAEKTGGFIVGRIEPSFLPRLTVLEKYGTDEDLFMYDFYLHAPLLDNYQHNLFTIFHGIAFYPVIVQTEAAIKQELFSHNLSMTANTEDEFLDLLRKIFNSPTTLCIINSILAQLKQVVPAAT